MFCCTGIPQQDCRVWQEHTLDFLSKTVLHTRRNQCLNKKETPISDLICTVQLLLKYDVSNNEKENRETLGLGFFPNFYLRGQHLAKTAILCRQATQQCSCAFVYQKYLQNWSIFDRCTYDWYKICLETIQLVWAPVLTTRGLSVRKLYNASRGICYCTWALLPFVSTLHFSLSDHCTTMAD